MRRVLARLLREVRRDVDRGGTTPPPDADALEDISMRCSVSRKDARRVLFDTARRARAGAAEEHAPTPKPKSRATGPVQQQLDLDGDLDDVLAPRPSDRVRAQRAQHGRADSEPPPAPRLGVKASRARDAERGSRNAERESLDDFEHAAGDGPSAGARIGLGLLVLALVFVGAYLFMGRENARSAVGMADNPSRRRHRRRRRKRRRAATVNCA